MTQEATEQTEETPPPPRRRFNLRRVRIPLSNTQIILIILFLAGGRLIYDFSQRVVEGQDMVEEQIALEQEIIALEEENRALIAAEVYYSSDAYVESWAHDEGKLVRDGEVLIVPIYQQPPSQGLPAPVDFVERTEVEAVPPWQIWWSLFFDTTPPQPQLP